MFSANKLNYFILVGVAGCLVGSSLALAGRGRDRDEYSHQDESETETEIGSGAGIGGIGGIGAGFEAGGKAGVKQVGEMLNTFMGNFMGGALAGGAGKTKGATKLELGDQKEVSKTGTVELSEWVKLMFNPSELVKQICVHYKIDYNKTSAAIGKQLIYGVEAVLTPLVVTAKIVEKVFVPDSCKLLFVCKMGHHLEFIKVKVLKLSSKFLEGSQYLRALSDGVTGRSCEEIFSSCKSGEPKLNREYEELRRSLGLPQSISANNNSESGSATAESQAQLDRLSPASAPKATKAAVNQVLAPSAT